jgi:hypothetical protein
MATKAIASAYEVVSAIDTIKKTFNNLSDIFTGSALNKQQTAFNTLEGYFKGRALLSVETPWKTYKDMVIESFSADQAEDTQLETTFTLTFKQMRFISTVTNTGKLIGRVAAQAAIPDNKGAQAGGSALLNLGQGVGVISQ